MMRVLFFQIACCGGGGGGRGCGGVLEGGRGKVRWRDEDCESFVIYFKLKWLMCSSIGMPRFWAGAGVVGRFSYWFSGSG